MTRFSVCAWLLLLFVPGALYAQKPDVSFGIVRTDTVRFADGTKQTTASYENADIINVKKHGAVGSGLVDDLVGIRAAFAAAESGDVVLFPHGTYAISDTILVSQNKIMIRGEGATVQQTTAGKNLFCITSNSVTFKDLILIGDTNSSYTDEPDSNVGINFSTGTTGHLVENCNLSILDIAVYCHEVTGMAVKNCYIHDVYQGIIGGYDSLAHQDRGSSYLIMGNRIHCAFGPLSGSRPISLPYATDFTILGNELRGGGMAFESVTTSASDTSQHTRIFSKNSCDAAASGATVVLGNVFDSRYAPSGRGQQSGYYQAIETGYNGTVANNVVRYFNVGVSSTARIGRISGNLFESCGDSVSPGADGVIAFNSASDPDTTGAILSGNAFVNSMHNDIAVNWQADSDTMYDVIVTGNYSLGGRESFLIAARTQGVIVTNNYVRDGNSADSSAQAISIWFTNGTTGYIDNNTVINTLGAPLGAYQAIAASTGTVIGFTRTRGLRNSSEIDVGSGAEQIGRIESDGVLEDAIPAEVLTIRSINPWITIHNNDTTGDGGEAGIIIYDTTFTLYSRFKYSITDSIAYWDTDSNATIKVQIGSGARLKLRNDGGFNIGGKNVDLSSTISADSAGRVTLKTLLIMPLHTIVAGDSVFGSTFIHAADSTLKTWNGAAWVTIADLTP